MALTDLDDRGRVSVHGEYWNARADKYIPKGRKGPSNPSGASFISRHQGRRGMRQIARYFEFVQGTFLSAISAKLCSQSKLRETLT